MIGHPPPIGTQAEAVREPVICSGKLPGVRSIKIHAEDLANLVAHYLHQHTLVIQQQLRRVKDRHAVPRGNFLKRAGIEIVTPQVGWSQGVVLAKGPSSAVTTLFHAEE